jgi:hypothetical protein
MRQIDPVDLESFILDKGLSHKKNSISFIFDCPRCGKKDKLYIRRRDGRFVCWVCAPEGSKDGFRGAAEYALTELASMPLWEVIEEIYGESQDVPESGRLELDFDFGEVIEDGILESDIPIPTLQWPLEYYPITDYHSKRGLEYLESRGIPKEVCVEYDLRYCPQERRVVFPIKIDGRLVGWQKRLIIENKTWDEENGKWLETPKILSSTGIPRDRTLMFADRLKGSPHAVMCEGPVDALKCHQLGANVATMGKVVSKGQIALIAAAGVQRVYLALDPDAASETKRLLSTLGDVPCYLLQPPPGKKDLGECSYAEVQEAFLNAPLLNPGHLFIYFK